MTAISHPIESLTWAAFKERPEYGDFNKQSPRLVAALDGLLASTNHLLWRATYHYGELIVDDGQFVLPLGTTVEDERRFHELFWEEPQKYPGGPANGDHPCPFSVVLSKSVEVFMPQRTIGMDNHNIETWPLQIIQAGDVFGVFEFLDRHTSVPPAPMDGYSISSGARSVQIAATNRYYEDLWRSCPNKQKGQHAKDDPTALPHYRLICEYSRQENIAWSSSILLFPSWVMDTATAQGINELQELLLKRGWIQATHTRRSALHKDDRARTIVNHLSNLSAGYLPAFVYSGFINEVSGPFVAVETLLNEAMIRAGKPKHQVVIMQPWQLTAGQRGIYSFSTPQPYLGGQNRTKDLIYKNIAQAMVELALDGTDAYSAHISKADTIRRQVEAELVANLSRRIPDTAEVKKKVKSLCRDQMTIHDLLGSSHCPEKEMSRELCVREGIFSTCIRVTGRHKQVNPFGSGADAPQVTAQSAP